MHASDDVLSFFILLLCKSDIESNVQWLWRVLEAWDQEALARFLSFVTGCSCLPVDGSSNSKTLINLSVSEISPHLVFLVCFSGLRPPLCLTMMHIDAGTDQDKVHSFLPVDTATQKGSVFICPCCRYLFGHHTIFRRQVLPRAHTCFNQLVLPAYSTDLILEERLLFALSNTEQGFFMS